MDDLLILGCIVLLFALVVAPALAIVAFNRSSATRAELAGLRRRVEELEQQGIGKPKDVPAAQMPVQSAETFVKRGSVAQATPEPTTSWERE